MDQLDKLSTAAIIFLISWALVLAVYQMNQPPTKEELARRQAQTQKYLDPQLDKKIGLAKNLVINNNLSKAEELLAGLIKDYPFEAMPFMLKGDIYLRKSMPVLAMLEYRKAIDLNPDFLDKNAPAFEGKKIKKVVEEARMKIDDGLRATPDDSALKTQREELYYMLRKIAGSCSS